MFHLGDEDGVFTSTKMYEKSSEVLTFSVRKKACFRLKQLAIKMAAIGLFGHVGEFSPE